MMATALMVCLAAWGAPGERVAAGDAVAVAMVAIQATNENGDEAGSQRKMKSYDRALTASTREALERRKLPFDTFRHLGTEKSSAAYGQEAKLRINDRYTLFVSPSAKSPDGRIQTKIRIETQDGESSKNAVTTIVKAVPGDPLILAGLKLDEGELVVVLTISASTPPPPSTTRPTPRTTVPTYR